MSTDPRGDRGAATGTGLEPDVAVELLRCGRLEIEGRLVDASNATLYCLVSADGVEATCVYKPIAGERPLWDFPDGTLAYREVAAYALSAATGWAVVPPTVFRDGPFGPGMVQLWIDVDERVDLPVLARSDHRALRRMAVFDAIANNADRKGGHLLPTADGHVYGVDHGVCFAVEDKLRTLLWRWRGQPLPKEATEVLRRLRSDLSGERRGGIGERLRELLAKREVDATLGRVKRLLATGVYPLPSDDWPAIPWPPF
jgi:hypothetical protein